MSGNPFFDSRSEGMLRLIKMERSGIGSFASRICAFRCVGHVLQSVVFGRSFGQWLFPSLISIPRQPGLSTAVSLFNDVLVLYFYAQEASEALTDNKGTAFIAIFGKPENTKRRKGNRCLG